MVYCTKCGETNPDDSAHCTKCGERLFKQTQPDKASSRSVRRRSSNACWEDEEKGVSRQAIITLGIIFLIVAILSFIAIINPDEFEEFFVDLGARMEEFFTSASFQDAAEVIGPIVMILIGLAILFGTYRSSIRYKERQQRDPPKRSSAACWDEDDKHASLWGYLVGTAILFGGIVLAAELWYDISAENITPLIIAGFAIVIIWYGLKMSKK